MSVFQISGLTLLGVLVLYTLRAIFSRGVGARVLLLWLGVWISAGVAIMDPELTARLARVIGIRRGADLVFYCNVLVSMVGFFLLYLRHKRVERQLTVLVRELALSQPRLPAASSPGGAEQPGQ